MSNRWKAPQGQDGYRQINKKVMPAAYFLTRRAAPQAALVIAQRLIRKKFTLPVGDRR
jgi:hypothetical protein